jgi:tetratricopeptide (TPR) repeat protein
MTRAILFLLAICLACVASARTAHADDPAMRAAKRHYERGQKLFALQKFDEALEQFQAAFDAKPIPDFLFNIGQCHRNLGDYEAAIFSFKRYLKLDPDAENREQVEELITQLEEKKDAEDAKKRGLGKKRREPGDGGDGDRDRPQAAGSPFYKKWWFWTGVVVVGAAGGVGVYAATSGGGAPDTSLGKNIVFGK